MIFSVQMAFQRVGSRLGREGRARSCWGSLGSGLMKGGTRHLNVQVCSKKNTRGRRGTLLALCSHTHPHFNNSERRDMFASTSLVLYSLARFSMLSHLLEYCLFLMGRARCRMFSRPVEVVRLALVGGGFPPEEELDRTTDDIFGGPLSTRQIRWGGTPER